MRSAPAGTVKVMKPEEKQRTLSEFLVACLAEGEAAGSAATTRERTVGATLIAHSPSSPVALALASLSADNAHLKIKTRVIFSTIDTSVPGPMADGGPWLSTRSEHIALRQITDVRLCDAHEQLVIGGAAAWIGDCLRRDPSKRDAYETFAENDPVTRRFAEVSFERIWALAKPVTVSRPLAGPVDDATGEGETSPIDVAPLPIDFAATAMIATRH